MGGDRKELGLFDATMLVMGGIIGVGIFFTPAQVAAHVPVGWGFLGMWVLGGAVALCGAATFAELGGTFPRAGGWFEFLREIYGPFVAFLFAWVVLGVIATGAIAIIVAFGAETLLGVFGVESPWWHVALAVASLCAITGLVLFGVKAGATFQNVCMLAKLTAMAALVVAGLALYAPESAAPAAAASVAGAVTWKGVVAATLPVFFAFGGWQHVCYVADYVRDPQRTVPRAILLGVLGVGGVYLLVNLAYLRVLGVDAIATTPGFAAEVAERSFGAGGARALRAAMAVSAIGVCAVNVIVTPTIFVAMARNGLFFKSFARLNARGAPVNALSAQLVLALGYLAWAKSELLFGWSSERMNVGKLADSVVFAEWVFHGLTAWGLIRLRMRRPDLVRPYRSFAYPLAPLVYLVVAAGILGGNLKNAEWSMTGVGLGVLALGALVYAPWRAVMRSGA
jgi:APA family basic amino acid/polyamine antiporter